MRKLFKKSLACLLAAIFCVTLCVAAVPASAEAITYSTNDVVAKAGETVTINFAVSNFIKVKGAMIKFFLPDAVASVESVKLNGAEIAAYDAETGAGYYKVEDNAIKFLSLFGYEGELAAVETLTFNVTVKVAEDAEGTYTYAEPYFSVTEDGETLVTVTGAFGTFEVKNAPAVVEPVYDENFKFNSANVTLASSIALNFDMNKTTVDAYESGYVVFEKPIYNVDGSLADTLTITLDFADKTQSAANANRYALTFTALYPQDLGATITATPYGVKDGVTYVGKAQEYSVLTFISRQYANYPNLFANLINYGTVVQTENNYNTANMIDAAYTALAGSDAWKSDITADARPLVKSQTNTALEGAIAKVRGANVSLADKVIVNIRTATPSNGALDYTAGYQMKITYSNPKGPQEKIYDITEEYVAFDALSASEMSVVFTIVIIDAEGNEISNKVTYSIETFCANNVNTQTTALMKYGDAVAALNG